MLQHVAFAAGLIESGKDIHGDNSSLFRSLVAW
jgi:hypothetical protein